MTTTAERAVRRPADTRRAVRLTLAVLAPIGPLAVGLLRYVLPYETVDGVPATVRESYLEPGAMSLVLWLGFAAALTIVPGALGVGRLVHRQAPRLTAVALTLTVPAYLMLPVLATLDHTVWSAAEAGTSQASAVTLLEAAHPTTAIAVVVFVVGHVVGTVLLGLAMLRSGRVPAWAAVATIVSQPLHFVAAVVVPHHGLDGVAWGLNALGFAVAGLAIWRTPDDEWDLPPAHALRA